MESLSVKMSNVASMDQDTMVTFVLDQLKNGVDASGAQEWAEAVRIACREKETRFKLRAEPAVYTKLAELVESGDTKLAITVASALANIVVDDDKEFTACTLCCDSGLVKNVLTRGKKSVGVSEESKLQYVIAIAMTNFAMQLGEQQLTPEKVKKGNVPVITSVLKAENDPIPFALTLVLQGENAMVKRAALALVCHLASFEVCQERIIANEKIEEVLLQLCENCYSADEETQVEAVESIGKVFTRNYTYAPSIAHLELLKKSGTICIVATLMRGNAKVDGKDQTFTSKVGATASKVLQAFLMEEPLRRNLLLDCGVLNMVLEKLKFGEDSFKVYETRAPTEAEICAVELLLELLKPTEESESVLMPLLHQKLDISLANIVYVCSNVIKEELDDASDKIKEDPTQDIDRKKVLQYARYRKLCLYLISQMATSEARCVTIVSRKAELLASPEARVVPLCYRMMDKMAMFDFEAANLAANIMRNICLSNKCKKIVLSQVSPPALGRTTLKLATSQNPSTATVAAVVIRVFTQLRDLEMLSELLPEDALMNAITADTTKMHPVVRVELARALSHLVYTVATAGEKSSLSSKILTVEVIRLVAFLLQAEYPSLITEGLDALAQCDSELLKTASEQVLIYLVKEEGAEEEEEEEDTAVKYNPEKPGEGEAELEKALQALDDLDLDLNEADVDMENQDIATPREPVAEDEEKEPEVYTITLKERLQHIIDGTIGLKSDEGKDETKRLGKCVLDMMS